MPDSGRATSNSAASEPMQRYMRGEITAEDYLRLIRKQTAAIVRREQQARRRWGNV